MNNKPLLQFWKHLSIVLRKELIDAIRDRRSLVSALIYPLVGPMMILLMFQALADIQRDAEQLSVPISGQSHAPDLVAWLSNEGVQFEAPPNDVDQAILSGEVPLVLTISSDFQSYMQTGRAAPIQIAADGSRTDSRPKVNHLISLIQQYSSTLAARRLLARGINPIITQPIAIEKVETASPQKRAARLLAFIPLFIVIAAFVTGMQVAVDTTAGERERGSLEFLMLQPVSRQAIVAGKWLAAACFACVGTILTLFSCLAALYWLPMEELGFHLEITPFVLLSMLAISLPLVVFANALMILVSSFARSFKEAQFYLTGLSFLPAIPGLINTIYPLDDTLWMVLVPMLGQIILLSQSLAGELPELLPLLSAGAIAILGGYLCMWITARLFQRESIIFGR